MSNNKETLITVLKQELSLYRSEKDFFTSRYAAPISRSELLGRLKEWPHDSLVGHVRHFVHERALHSLLARGKLRFFGEQIDIYDHNPGDPLSTDISRLYNKCLEMHSEIEKMYDQYNMLLQSLLADEEFSGLRREVIDAIVQDINTYMSALADGASISSNTLSKPGYWAGYSVQQTDDGGYIIAGTRYSYEVRFLSQIVWLIKTDRNGSRVWDRIFGGERTDIGYSVQQTRDGGYIIAGVTESFGAGKQEAWLIKTDAHGNEDWNKTFGGPRDDLARSVQQTTDGGYIIAGSTYSHNAAHLSQMVWLIKTDADGNKIWDRIFGGPLDNWGNSVQQTNDGGYIITGATKSYGQGGKSALWLIKTDADGNEAWDRTFSRQGDTVGYSVQQTKDGGYIITGSIVPVGSITGEIWLIKTDSNGNEVWDKILGGSGEDVGKSVQQTSDGGYIIVGSNPYSVVSQGIWLIKTDANGNMVWDRIFGESGWNEGKSVQQTSDGGYIITGSTYPGGVSGGNSAVWLIKTNGKGDKIWDRTFG